MSHLITIIIGLLIISTWSPEALLFLLVPVVIIYVIINLQFFAIISLSLIIIIALLIAVSSSLKYNKQKIKEKIKKELAEDALIEQQEEGAVKELRLAGELAAIKGELENSHDKPLEVKSMQLKTKHKKEDKIRHQTIREYSEKKNMSVFQVLADLRTLGIYCNPGEVIKDEMLEALTAIYTERANKTKLRRAKEEQLRIQGAEEFKALEISRAKRKAKEKETEIKIQQEIQENMKEKTILEYSSLLNIPLEKVLEDFKSLGFSCKADDRLNADMREKFASLLREYFETKPEVIERKTKKDGLKTKTEEKLNNIMEKVEIRRAEKKATLEERKIQQQERLIKSIESEALSYAETKSAEILEQSLCGLKKIGKIIEICLDLCPENVKVACREKLGTGPISDLFPSIFYEALKKTLFFEKRYEAYKTHYKQINEITVNDWRESLINHFFDSVVPVWVMHEYNYKEFLCLVSKNEIKNKNFASSTDDSAVIEINKYIQERIKRKIYSSALVSILVYISSYRFLFGVECVLGRREWSHSEFLNLIDKNNIKIIKYDFRNLSFVGDLLLDMMVSDSCFELYSVDSRLFQNPKSLGLLVDAAIKAGNLEKSQELLAKLIDSEPYHPTIPILKLEIKRLENRSVLRANFSIDFSKINELSGLEFEKLLYDKFSELGFKVESTPKTGDFGADLIIENKEGTRIVVQCKRFTSKVNLKAVQEVIGAIGYYSCDLGVVITNNSFLNSAVKLAESHDIELWDGDKLVSFLAGDLSFSKIIGD